MHHSEACPGLGYPPCSVAYDSKARRILCTSALTLASFALIFTLLTVVMTTEESKPIMEIIIRSSTREKPRWYECLSFILFIARILNPYCIRVENILVHLDIEP